MKKEKLMLGLDIGTNSVGWCLIDENSHIVKKNRKYLWGARLFEEAESCENRRKYRSARRLLARRKLRIDLLQELFCKPMNEVDPNFFIRLNQSQLHDEDKGDNKWQQLLFNDYKLEKEYYKNYPTIYHLRNALCKEDKKFDLRYVYLAIQHIIKNRGNFLYPEDYEFKVSNNDSIQKGLDDINSDFNYAFTNNKDNKVDNKYVEEFKNIYTGKNNFKDPLPKSDRKKGIENLFDELLNKFNDFDGKEYSIDDLKKFLKDTLIPLVFGGERDINKILSSEVESFKINYEDEESIQKLDNLIAEYDENSFDYKKLKAIKDMKQIYDYILLTELLGESSSISEAMIVKYNKHKQDLAKLKKCIKEEYGLAKYNELFRKDKQGSYSYYIGKVKTKGKKVSVTERKEAKSSFTKILSNKKDGLLVQINSNSKYYDFAQNALKDIEEDNFLPLLRTTNNRVIPHQLHENELKLILDNQAKYYPFLEEVKSKVLSLLSFRIPYYVGPIGKNTNKNDFSWFERKEGHENDYIYPWNFDEIVDKDASEEKFINRMLGKCSYIHSKCCLPKISLIYQEYNVLSELNKILINNEPIKKDQKDYLIENLYYKGIKPTVKKIINFLAQKEGVNVSTIELKSAKADKALEDAYFNSNMSTYVKLIKAFGNDENINKNIDNIEEALKDCSIISEKDRLKKRLESKYHFNEVQVNAFIKIQKSANGFGSISKYLLTDLRGLGHNGEVICDKSIIELMRETNLNLMEILHDSNYGFGEAIRFENQKEVEALDIDPNDKFAQVKEYIDELYVSPKMKRPLIQAFKIATELENIMGQPIDEYYLEATRGDDITKKGKRTLSRKENFKVLYKSCKDISDELNKQLEDTDESKFNSKAVYLYFSQLGKDLYTGQPIDFGKITNKKDYDIDHIYPQSLIKDDNFDNLVLTASINNSKKGNKRKIPFDEFPNNLWNDQSRKNFYKKLKDANLISESKYQKLIRTKELTDKELMDFVSEQIVTTSQAVKALRDTLQQFKKDSKGRIPRIVLSKAKVISDFRKNHDLLKVRDANNLHHAHDAYLNAVIGRAVDTYFTLELAKSVKTNIPIDQSNRTTNVNKFLDNWERKNKKTGIVEEFGQRHNIYDGKYLVWDYSYDGNDYKITKSLKEIDYNIKKNFNVLVTTRTYIGTSILHNVTIRPKSYSNLSLNKKKELSAQKYGGYQKLEFGFYTLVSTKTKSGVKYNLIAIPGIIGNSKNIDNIKKYCRNLLNVEEISIEIPYLNTNTIFVEGCSKYCVSGKSNTSYVLQDLNEIHYLYSDLMIIKKINKISEKLVPNKIYSKIECSKELEEKEKQYINKMVSDKGIFVSTNNDNETIYLTKDELSKLIVDLIGILNKQMFKYSNQFSSLAKGLQYCLDNINNYSLLELVVICNNSISWLNNSRQLQNLQLINMANQFGTLKMPSIISKNISIVYESITGYYQKVVWSNKK